MVVPASPFKMPPTTGDRGGAVPPVGSRRGSASVCGDTIPIVWKTPTRNLKEQHILRLLSGYQHFPRLIDLPPSVKAPLEGAFAMEYIPDRSVRSLAELQLLGTHLASALVSLHSLGYVHCDVKRSNVRFTGTKAFLIDFDCARQWRPGDAPLHGPAGTPSWRAPEASGKGDLFTNKVDIYGLGLVLYDELLCLSFRHFWRGTRP